VGAWCWSEPGVVTETFQIAVEKLGLFYPPDPASLKFSTLGGNVAECAGGPRAVKYGVTKDFVMGLEVVLPTGQVIRTGGETVKGVVGYDLTKLICGSEGTLGVITKIIFKLLPYPDAKKTMLTVFDSIDGAARAVSTIIKNKIIPTTLEFMDHGTLTCVERRFNLGMPETARAVLLIEVDGDRIVVPRSKVPDVIRRIERIQERYDIPIVNFGHAGDGNIHVNIMIDKSVPGELEKAHEAIKEVFQAALDLGGTMSGEHGVGLAKQPFIPMELSADQVMAMKAIKGALDPNNILNPGKIF